MKREEKENVLADFNRGEFRHQVRTNRLPPLQPRNWFIDQKGNGLVFRVVNSGRIGTDGPINGAVRYDFHWAENVDTSTADGIDAGFRRSKVVASAMALGIEDMESESPVLDNEDYQSGYFYCVAVSADGERSAIGQPKHITNQILARNIPANVEHFQVSESGEMHNGTVWSALSCSYKAPAPLRGFGAVQLVLEHFPNLNEVTYWVIKKYAGLGGGSAQFKENAQVCRRVGVGTITVTAGATGIAGASSLFTQQMRAGDYLEIGGVRGQIASVTDDDTATLSANWAGRSYVAFASWEVIGLVRVYARALSDGGVGEADLSGLPFVDVLLDGNLSAPNAPTVTATARGNTITLTWQQVLGTQIKGYRVFRGLGAGTPFADCSAVGWVEQPKDTAAVASSRLEYVDTDFTIFEREQATVFSYYVVTVNERDEPSAPSTGVEGTARLDSPADVGPPGSAREIALNLLWNGHINGTAAGAVGTGDAVQDANMGGGAPAGWNRWSGAVTGAGSAPGHISTNEVVLAMTGAPGAIGASFIQQQIDAVDHGTAGNRRVPTWKPLVLQVKARTSGGAMDAGHWLAMYIEQYNGGALTAPASLRQRLSDDTLDFGDSTLFVFGDDITEDHQVYYGVFVLDPTAVTTHIVVTIGFATVDWSGVNVYLTEAMLSFGENLPQYTPQLPDPDVTYSRVTGGAPEPPPLFADQEARAKGYAEMLVP